MCPAAKSAGKNLSPHSTGCHSIQATGESPLKGDTHQWEIYLKYPIEQLEYGFAEGMGWKTPTDQILDGRGLGNLELPGQDNGLAS